MIAGLLATATWAFLALAAGSALPGRRSPGENLALGAAALSLVAFWASLAGVPLAPPLLGLLAALAVGAAMARGPWKRQAGSTGVPVPARPSPLEGVALVALAAALAVVAAQALHEPLLSWDARTHWTYLARVLYFEGSVSAPILYQPSATVLHHDYPLLVPLSEWAVFVLQGSADDHAARLVSVVFYAAFLGALGAVLARATPRPLPLVGTALVGTTPFLILLRDGGASSGYADLPVALMVTAYLGLVLDWARGREAGPLLVASLAGCGVLFTKREGLPLAALLLLVPLAACPRRWREVLAHAALLAALSLPWLAHWQALPADFGVGAVADPAAARAGLDRLPGLLGTYAFQLFGSPALWGLLGWVVAGLALTGGRHRRLEAGLLAVVLLYLALHLVVYVTSPRPPSGGNPTTRVRILFHVAPAAALYAALRASRLLAEPDLGDRGGAPPPARTGTPA